jgi:hypothetical protein
LVACLTHSVFYLSLSSRSPWGAVVKKGRSLVRELVILKDPLLVFCGRSGLVEKGGSLVRELVILKDLLLVFCGRSGLKASWAKNAFGAAHLAYSDFDIFSMAMSNFAPICFFTASFSPSLGLAGDFATLRVRIRAFASFLSWLAACSDSSSDSDSSSSSDPDSSSSSDNDSSDSESESEKKKKKLAKATKVEKPVKAEKSAKKEKNEK